MAMYFHIFGKKRCKYCTKAVKLLESKKLDYVVSYMEKAPKVLDELKTGVDWKTVPIVLEVLNDNSVFVGGYTELEEYLNGSNKEKKTSVGEGTDTL